MYYNIIIDTDIGELTSLKKTLHILNFYPETRDSYDALVMKYREEFPNDNILRSTIERDARMVQRQLEIFPSSKRVRAMRDEIHDSYKIRTEKETILQFIFRKLFR